MQSNVAWFSSCAMLFHNVSHVSIIRVLVAQQVGFHNHKRLCCMTGRVSSSSSSAILLSPIFADSRFLVSTLNSSQCLLTSSNYIFHGHQLSVSVVFAPSILLVDRSDESQRNKMDDAHGGCTCWS